MRSLFTFLLLVSILPVFAQQPVAAPKKNGKYEKKQGREVLISGMCKNGYKVGTWTYTQERRTEVYDENGILLRYTQYNTDLYREEDYDAKGVLLRYRKYNGDLDRHEEFNLKNGQLHGVYRRSRALSSDGLSGEVTGWYTNGKKDSVWNYFPSPYGNSYQPWKSETWKEDRCVEMRRYYPGGKLFYVKTFDEQMQPVNVTYYNNQGEEWKIDTTAAKKDSAQVLTEEMPDFPGGFAAYIQKNVYYPTRAKEAGKQGTVYVSFVINRYGAVEDVKVKKGIPGAKDLENEAVRIIEMMPPWTPGKIDGKPVRVTITQPIRFILQ